MPKTYRFSWLNSLQKWFNNNLSLLALVFCLLSFVFWLYDFCYRQSLQNDKRAPVLVQQPVYNHFCCCNCYTPSVISPFLIKLPHYMLKQPSRLVIYASDIRLLTGCSKRASQYQIKRIKEKLKKENHQYLTIEEYCIEMGLNYEKTLQQLKLL